MKKVLVCLVSCLLLTACSPKDTHSSEAIDYETTYNKAVELTKAGDRLNAAQTFMKIFSYKDSLSQYRKLLLHNRVSLDAYCIGLLTDAGEVKVIGDDGSLSMQKETEQWNNVVAISSHAYGIIGLKNDGTVLSTTDTKKTKWYAGAEVVNNWSNVVDITCGTYHSVGLKEDGTVIATKYVGDFEYNKGQCNISSWNGIVAIAAGSTHTVGLKSDGTVIATGDNSKGQCNVEGWTDIVAISACSENTLGLKSDGTVVITGRAQFSAVSDWSDIVQATIGYAHVVGLKADGTVVATGSNNNGECDTQNWSNMRCAVAGSSISVGIKSDGTIIFIGNESCKMNEANGYNLFTGIKDPMYREELQLPSSFPSDIPLYEMNELLKVSETSDATVIAFSTKATFDDAFKYYEAWCSNRGGYLKQPYEDNLDMLISPIHDLKKAVVFVVTKGVELEDGTTTNSPGVIVMIQGGKIYDSVVNLK